MKWRDKLVLSRVLVLVVGLGIGLLLRRRCVPTEAESNDLVEAESDEEALFRRTLRSCIGAACLTAVPAGSKPRVALLSPGGEYASALWRTVKDLADVDLVETTHAPPYGYGKNHGWTRIVRLALPLGLANSSLELRQLVRWHCRVSHVAAHTALLTVEDPHLPTILSFAGVKLDHALLDAAHARRLAPPTRRLTPDLLAALREELSSTNTLRKWPCKSLWLTDLGDDHPPHVAQRARALVPNCSAPFTTCGVQRDLCEQSPGGHCPPPPKRSKAGKARR